MKYDNDYVKNLEYCLYFANAKVVELSTPYNLTINEIEQEIRSLKELKAILESYKEPINIKLEEKKLRKK